MGAGPSADAIDCFASMWAAFDAGAILPACAWCRRVRIDEIWVVPSPAALAAIDQRHAFSHSICEVCAADLKVAAGRDGASSTQVTQ